jgi:hypothetical protein
MCLYGKVLNYISKYRDEFILLFYLSRKDVDGLKEVPKLMIYVFTAIKLRVSVTIAFTIASQQ